jgi:DNA-binding NarL/FixJ family response regulator
MQDSPTPRSASGRSGDQSTWNRPVGGHIRVLVVEDQAAVRESFCENLKNHPEVEVVGDASNGREAMQLAEKLRPDVILMDLVMPGLNGLEATRQIKKRLPRTKVLMLTGYMEDEQIIGALRAGASGYFVKTSGFSELVLAIQAVHRGNTYFSSDISSDGAVDEYMWRAKSEEGKVGYEQLTSREREVLQLIAEGHTNQGIADELVISVKTVEAHKAHIMSKLRAQHRTDLIRYALRKGLVGLDVTPDLEGDTDADAAGQG